MKKFSTLALFSALIAFTSFSCSSDDKSGNDTGGGSDTGKTKYIITATTGATGVADYLLTADDVSTGSITTIGNGVEQDGTYRYYITAQNNFFSLLYGQGNPGAVTTYNLNTEGKLVKKSDFQAETVHVFAAVNKDILTIKVPRSGASIASMYKIDAVNSLITGEAQQDTKVLAGNGERAFFTWATQVGDKVYMPYMSIKGDGVDNFGTVNPDSTWVAVYNYPELKLEKVIKDNRTSYLGAYFTNGLFQDENGDAYGFSGAIATSNAVLTSTKPSAIVKIKKGTTEFDQSYFFNVEEKSGGYKISSTSYISKGKFLLLMYGNAGKNNGAVKLAVADVYNQTFTWVTNAPATLTSATSRYNITTEDGNAAIIGINTPEGNWIYTINGTTGVATRGMKVEGGQITAIAKLKY
ncbi:DUF4374 domain-containing protein [Flavobacterium pectinovorum]|uniref:DUF4374 domain-containing protein n=1 Tax=Flavobacterium pectinovorum TaxID=29533 RepID=A0AB36NXS1_9FLAO|nr:DUF4374 domain-containing protein [Flavobacterium pectinovorum]OXB01938.1 hypothetical protein B0A72_18020 [Flavobacterium pectinovorum]SHN15982.1 protein of unknown function [Flavobacterium pectinovorum]